MPSRTWWWTGFAICAVLAFVFIAFLGLAIYLWGMPSRHVACFVVTTMAMLALIESGMIARILKQEYQRCMRR